LERWPTSGTAWHGGFSTHVSSECRSDEDGCSSSEPSLTEILESPQTVPAKYSLSARAARGILRRAEKRGRTLPGHLAVALEAVAGHRTPNAWRLFRQRWPRPGGMMSRRLMLQPVSPVATRHTGRAAEQAAWTITTSTATTS